MNKKNYLSIEFSIKNYIEYNIPKRNIVGNAFTLFARA